MPSFPAESPIRAAIGDLSLLYVETVEASTSTPATLHRISRHSSRDAMAWDRSEMVDKPESRRSVFTVRRYALHGICDSNSVCLCHTRGLCPHGSTYDHDFFTIYGSPIILVSGDITLIPKFEGGHPERGCWMRVGWVQIGDFRPMSRRISETVGDTTKVTINH